MTCLVYSHQETSAQIILYTEDTILEKFKIIWEMSNTKFVFLASVQSNPKYKINDNVYQLLDTEVNEAVLLICDIVML